MSSAAAATHTLLDAAFPNNFTLRWETLKCIVIRKQNPHSELSLEWKGSSVLPRRHKNKLTSWVEEESLCLIGLYFMAFLGSAYMIIALQLSLKCDSESSKEYCHL